MSQISHIIHRHRAVTWSLASGVALLVALVPLGSEGTSNVGSGDQTINQNTAAGFTITNGAVKVLSPGISKPVNVTFINPNRFPLIVSNLVVTRGKVSAPNATDTLRCTGADFTVVQASARVKLTIGAKKTLNLQQLKVAKAKWPTVALINNHDANQDGCKGATVTLKYIADGRQGR